MSDRYPPEVRRLNRILQAELGDNPRYAWRWSEDLRHVMNVIDDVGRPEYVERLIDVRGSDKQIIARVHKTAVRRLLPWIENQWVACALVEVNRNDGEIAATGEAAWMPISSSRSGVAALPPNVEPTIDFTQMIINAVRAERSKVARDPLYLDHEYEDEQRKLEKQRWNLAYDMIRDACTAFSAVPGRKGHVSFGGVDATLL